MATALRLAVEADLPSLREIHRRSSLSNERDRAHLLAHPEVLELSEDAVRDRRTTVVTLGGAVAGFATVAEADRNLELVDLFVDPDWMRRGLGRRLVDAVVFEARQRGVQRIEVTGNTHALAFYERVGFVVDGIVQTRFDPGLRLHLDVDGSGS